jgi:hypothetical protein
MNFFQRRAQPRGTTEPSGDMLSRVAAMNAGAANAKTPQEAIGVMQDAAGITGDLYKSFEALLQREDIGAIVAGLPEEEAQSLGISSDLLKSFRAISNKGDKDAADAAKDDDKGEEVKADDEKPVAEEKPVETSTEALPDESTDGSPDDDELAAPAAAPEAIAAATGKTGDDPKDDETETLAKSFEQLVGEAQRDAAANGAEILVNANELIGPLLKSIAATQQHQAQNSATLEVTNDYLEQVGALLTKSLEGIAMLHANQQAQNERLDRMEQAQGESIQAGQQHIESFTKSFGPVLDFVNNKRQAPQYTPTGSAPLPEHAVQGVALSDVVPMVQEQEETRGGFTRSELKKSIEAHLRSDESKNSGITTAHYLAIGRSPLDELDRSIFEVAAKMTGRALPTGF